MGPIIQNTMTEDSILQTVTISIRTGRSKTSTGTAIRDSTSRRSRASRKKLDIKLTKRPVNNTGLFYIPRGLIRLASYRYRLLFWIRNLAVQLCWHIICIITHCVYG